MAQLDWNLGPGLEISSARATVDAIRSSTFDGRTASHGHGASHGGKGIGTLECIQSWIRFIGFSAGGQLAGHLSVAWAHRFYPHFDEKDSLPCRLDFAIMDYPWRSVSQPPANGPNSGALRHSMSPIKGLPPC
jgi:hypothetical protein